MNLAYKHLDSKLRIAELSVGQWIVVLLGAGTATLWGLYLSPFGTSLSIISAIYIGAIPAGAAILAGISEFDLWLLIRSALRWRRLDGRFVSGPGCTASGYLVHEPARAPGLLDGNGYLHELDLASLWEQA